MVIQLVFSLMVSILFGNAPTCTATWYDTSNHPRVHREYSTAAYYDWKYLNKKFVVTNIDNNKSDTVVITDRHSCGPYRIDLSKTSFSKIANPSQGKIKVKMTPL